MSQRVQKLEQELEAVQATLDNLDRSMLNLLDTIEEMKPAYLHAMRILSQANTTSVTQKNNLVFYGIEPDTLELQMAQEPEFCRDILETRIKLVFREHLKIKREIPFTHIYRVVSADPNPDEIRPIVAGFKSIRDKENILRHATSNRLLKQKGIFVTEDFSNKKVATGASSMGGPQNVPGSPSKGSVSPKKTQNGPGRDQVDSSAAMSDRISSCNSDYAPSSNSGHSSSGGYTD